MTAPAPRAVVVVANPAAGGFRQARLDRLLARLRSRGLGVRAQLTTHAGHLRAIAAGLPEETGTLVVCGGDGSINEALQGLVLRPVPPPVLAVLPFGTANVLAHELGQPFGPEALADLIAAGSVRTLHPGLAGDRPFALMVSAGFDARVVHGVDPALKRRTGKLAYGLAALRLALARDGRDVTVEADGQTCRARIAIVTTARHYGGPMTLTRATAATDPGLRLVMLDDDRPLHLARAAVMLALGRLGRMAGVTDMAVERVRLSGPGAVLQIDGDALEGDSIDVRAAPFTLAVAAPPGR